LNGQSAWGGSATEFEVANGGNIYAHNSQGQWSVWTGSGWTSSSSPSLSPPPASPPPPAPSISPDGTILLPGQVGSLVANSGTWSFGSATNAYGREVLLNGRPIAGSYAVELEVANGGNLFNQNA